jgi:hypothetical protein
LLLLGEVHGVRENPLVIRSLMQAFELSGLALEWHEDLAPVAGAFLAGGLLADHPLLCSAMAGSPRGTWRSCGSVPRPGR